MKKYYLSAILLVSVLLSCGKEEKPVPAVAGDEVQFGVGKASALTKTIYADEDDIPGNGDAWDLLWVEGDKVRVYCEQASVKEAPYLVHADVKALEKTAAAGIQWGDVNQRHDFYAVYPDDVKLKSYDAENHIVEFYSNSYQTAVIKSKNGPDYSTSCDMTNAYMVSKRTGVDPQTVNVVGMTFDPIMTTLKIRIHGPADNSKGVHVTGVSVITSVPTTDMGAFAYDIDNMSIVEGGPVLEETFFVAINDPQNVARDPEFQNGVTGFKLYSGETVTVNAFIPPVALGNGHTYRIRVHTTGAYGSKTVTGNAPVAPSSKRRVDLPKLPTELVGNNWITPLDDNVYVNQLSIPGTHDAATYNFSSSAGLSGILGNIYANYGKTQEISIVDQWNIGIRAFDLRPAVYSGAFGISNPVLYIYHGIVRTGQTLEQSLTDIISRLQANPGEFAIVTMRHESEIGDLPVFGQDQSAWPRLMGEMMNRINSPSFVKDGYKGTINFKPDLTVGEMRGHILFISRDAYDNGPVGAYVNGWGGSSSDLHYQTIRGSGGNCSFLVQDYYDLTVEANADGEAPGKVAAIKNLLDRSAQFNTYQPWVLNHVSGYSLKTNIMGNEIPSIDGYRANAGYCNPLIHDYLTGGEWSPGPAGIVLMDFVGARTSKSYTVYGDILPQVIIDNNYKYTMRRKGE